MKDHIDYLQEHDLITYENEAIGPSQSAKGLIGKSSLTLLSSNFWIPFITALEQDLRVLAAIGMRTVFDQASEYLGVEPHKSFDKKLDQLLDEGHIGASEKERLGVFTDAGSAAAHRAWEPDLQQLNTRAKIMEHFLQSILLKAEAGTLKLAIPPRQKKRNQGGRGLPPMSLSFLLQSLQRALESLCTRLADITARWRHVRFLPQSRHSSARFARSLCAISRLPNSFSLLLHHLMVDQLERIR